jgi:hypothetical protein
MNSIEEDQTTTSQMSLIREAAQLSSWNSIHQKVNAASLEGS